MNKIFRANQWTKLGCILTTLFTVGSLRAQTNVQHTPVKGPPPAPRRPNIVLILADNIGYGDLGCYGQTKIQTPNLDKLAADGIRFTSYYTGSPKDEASRASLFTGLEPRHIDSSFSHPLPMNAFTVAALLKETGYHTGLMGEWNLGDTAPVEPNTKGFMEFAGSLSQAHARDYFSDNIYRQDTTSGSNRLETIPQNWNGQHGRYLPDLFGAAGAGFIHYNHPDRFNGHRAFFLCVAYPIPHNGAPPPRDPQYSNESWPQPDKDRAAMISRMDESIGHILSELEVWRVQTNTVVIFTSIGGAQTEGAMSSKFFHSSGPLRGEAGSVYEGGIRVPMIIRWPARIEPHQVSDSPWAAWDIMPTLAEIALTKDTEKTDGLSILPILTGKGKLQKHESFYWETQDGNEQQQAARMGDWKIVRLGNDAPALYNLKTDMSETNNVAAQNPKVLNKMKALLGNTP